MSTRTHRRVSAQPCDTVRSRRRRPVVAVERLWSQLTDLLAPRPLPTAATQLVLSPRRLEPRRMLDAGAAAAVLESLDQTSPEYVQASGDTPEESLASDEFEAAGFEPIVFSPTAGILEGDVASIEFTYDVAGAHTAEINWGDGSAIESFSLQGDSDTIQKAHRYLDDSLSTAASDQMPVTVRILSAAGAPVEESTAIQVDNVAPTLTVVANQTANEGSPLSIVNIGTFTDPGSDTFNYSINWGDGSASSTGVATIDAPASAGNPAQGSFDGTHTFADNGVYTVTVRLADDDMSGDFVNGTAGVDFVEDTFLVTVNNVVPTLNVTPSSPTTINEGGSVGFNASFSDPGRDNPLNPLPTGPTLESFRYSVTWGDGQGTIPSLAVGDVNSFGLFNGNHTYADSGTFTVTVRLADDDMSGDFAAGVAGVDFVERTFAVTVINVVPTLTVVGPQTVTEGSLLTLTDLGTITDPGADTFNYQINWGDATAVSAGAATIDTVGNPTLASFNGSHTYADNGVYTVRVRVADDDMTGNFAGVAGIDFVEQTFTVTVNNVAPTLIVTPSPLPTIINEGGTVSFVAMFSDPGFDNSAGGTQESFTYSIEWDDNRDEVVNANVSDTGGMSGAPSTGTFNGTHVYADNGTYTVTVTIRDDDGGQDVETFTVTVNNVAPTLLLTPSPSPTVINEGSPVSFLATFSDPGFDNLAGGTQESFTYSINWGDNRDAVNNAAIADVNGGPGVNSTGQFSGSHVYADNGTYTVTVTIRDDDGGQDVETFSVIVNNVAPTLVVVPAPSPTVINEGGSVSFNATFSDPGFDNPAGGTQESFTYSIDWDDNRDAVTNANVSDTGGMPGAPSKGTFNGTHVYADNGTYTVTVTIRDDDGGQDVETFTVTVRNVAPTLIVTPSPLPTIINEGGTVSFIATFSDPGFDNPAGGTVESFTYLIDWDDSRDAVTNAAVSDTGGMPGAPSTGTFNASHVYADNGTYTVTVTIRDDDGGQDVETFTVTVNNAAPTLIVTPSPLPTIINEGGTVTFVATFSDPGFDNPAGGTQESFTYSIDWGDARDAVTNANVSDTGGMPGAPSTGTFSGTHIYADNGAYTVTVTIRDDDGGQDVETFIVTVNNVAPIFGPKPTPAAVDEGAALSFGIDFSDPGFDNPALGTEESFQYSIDWGDGRDAITDADIVDTGGAPGADSKGRVTGTHYYADNGTYTVTVTIRDDDGGEDVEMFAVTVRNVDPRFDSVSAPSTADEGETISITALFSDPGFDNPANPLPIGPTAETFSYSIDWGDNRDAVTNATVADVNGGPFGSSITPRVRSTGRIDGTHAYADDGIYTIRVTIRDDDGGEVFETFTVQVSNAPPELLVEPLPEETFEGRTVTVDATFTDPGFDNPGNIAPGLNGAPSETAEFFTYSITWGDGKSDSGAIADAGNLTGPSAGAFLVNHIYADDARYAVKITLRDDDGSEVSKDFTVLVKNDIPVLTIASAVSNPIFEGEVAEVSILADFTDPGFNNDLNTALFPGRSVPEKVETFSYQIDWGDGTTVESFNAYVPTSDGRSTPSSGRIEDVFRHRYTDNDLDGSKDGRYTVKMTVTDDDEGISEIKTFVVVVSNRVPVISNVVATPLTSGNEPILSNDGFITLTITFTDSALPAGANSIDVARPPGTLTETFTVVIDWGASLAPLEVPYPIGTAKSLTVTSPQYTEPPDPDNQTADIVITIVIRDDDFGLPTDIDPATIDGQSLPVTVNVTNPGLTPAFRIDTTPQVRLLTLPERPATQTAATVSNPLPVNANDADVSGASGDLRAAGERFFQLRVLRPDGETFEEVKYKLPDDILKRLTEFLRTLPDNQYAIYLVQPETGIERLVIKVFVRDGKLFDPSDDREGARDRPPTDEAIAPPAAVDPDEQPVQQPAAEATDPAASIDWSQPVPSAAGFRHREALVGAATALCAAGPWRTQIEQTLAAAKPKDWKRLRTAGYRRRRKPR